MGNSPVTAEKLYAAFLVSSNTVKRVKEYLVPGERHDTVYVTVVPLSAPVMLVSPPLLFLSMYVYSLLLLTLSHCSCNCVSERVVTLRWISTGAETEECTVYSLTYNYKESEIYICNEVNIVGLHDFFQ